MAEVTLHIRGQRYPIWCEDGQESRIEALAAYVSERLGEMAASDAASSDNHLLVLTALILADEVFELRDAMKTAKVLIDGSGEEGRDVDVDAVVEALRSLTSRIAGVSDRIKAL